MVIVRGGNLLPLSSNVDDIFFNINNLPPNWRLFASIVQLIIHFARLIYAYEAIDAPASIPDF